MKIVNKVILIIFIAALGWSCEDTIYPELEKTGPQVVIDAWINNKPEAQQIRITETLPYYDAVTPPGVKNAVVYIIDNEGNRYDFMESEDGVYEWIPDANQPVFGKIGGSYELHVQFGERIYTAVSAMNRVPQIDSIAFRYEEETFSPAGYYAGVYATDLVGPGDSYWIKSYKNGRYLNRPSEINIAFDAGFTAGGSVDGIPFIQPIRDAVNPSDTDDNGDQLPPYEPGDSLYVEIHSITNEAFTYLNELKIQTNRPGGFAELFSVPLSNIPTNILTQNPDGNQALGFFNVSAVSTLTGILDTDNLPE